jgi:hypothetical protein
MPRSWQSWIEYSSRRSTGLPQVSHLVTRFCWTEPHSWQVTVSSCGWSVAIFAAVGAGHAQELETLELAALALPLADRILHEIERAGLAEIGEREDAREDRLQALIGPLVGSRFICRKRS